MSAARSRLHGFGVAKVVLSEDWESDHLMLLDTRGKVIGLDKLQVGPTEGTVLAEAMVYEGVPFRFCRAQSS